MPLDLLSSISVSISHGFIKYTLIDAEIRKGVLIEVAILTVAVETTDRSKRCVFLLELPDFQGVHPTKTRTRCPYTLGQFGDTVLP